MVLQSVELRGIRRSAVQLVGSRSPLPVQTQVRGCDLLVEMGSEDAVRLWKYVASYYEVDAERLRAGDNLLGNLRGLVDDYSRDIWLETGLVNAGSQIKTKAEALIQSESLTISEFVGLLRDYERESGRYLRSPIRSTSTTPSGAGQRR